MACPREIGQCQHTINADQPVAANGSMGKYEAMGAADGPSNLFGVGGIGKALGDAGSAQAAGFQQFEGFVGQLNPDTPDAEVVPGAGILNKDMLAIAGGIFQSDESHYAAVPIYVGGHAVGTLCTIDRQHRSGKDAIPVARLEHYAARVSRLFEAERSRREAAAPTAVTVAPPQALAKSLAKSLSRVRVLESGEEFDALTKSLAIVYFTAAWCGPCKRVGPVFDNLAGQYPGVLACKVDVDKLGDVAGACGVRATPIFQVWKDGQRAEEMTLSSGDVDTQSKQLEMLFKKYSSPEVPTPAAAPASRQSHDQLASVLVEEGSRLWFEARRRQAAEPSGLVSDAELAALRARAGKLRTAELITHDELFELEDLVADFLELQLELKHSLQPRLLVEVGRGEGANTVAALVHTAVGLSVAFSEDEAYARQLQRKLHGRAK